MRRSGPPWGGWLSSTPWAGRYLACRPAVPALVNVSPVKWALPFSIPRSRCSASCSSFGPAALPLPHACCWRGVLVRAHRAALHLPALTRDLRRRRCALTWRSYLPLLPAPAGPREVHLAAGELGADECHTAADEPGAPRPRTTAATGSVRPAGTPPPGPPGAGTRQHYARQGNRRLGRPQQAVPRRARTPSTQPCAVLPRGHSAPAGHASAPTPPQARTPPAPPAPPASAPALTPAANSSTTAAATLSTTSATARESIPTGPQWRTTPPRSTQTQPTQPAGNQAMNSESPFPG